MWSSRARTLSQHSRAALRTCSARDFSSQARRHPNTGLTVALTATLTATLCYASTYLTSATAAPVLADSETASDRPTGHYADATIATKKVQQEIDKDAPQYASKETIKNIVIPKLQELLAKKDQTKVSDDEEERMGHAQAGGTHHEPTKPDVVVYVESTEDVVKVVKLANQYRVPVVPFSGGTSLEGHITAPYGGICVDLSRMDKVLAVRGKQLLGSSVAATNHAPSLRLFSGRVEEDSDATVQPGVPWMDLNAELESRGINLFLPLDPGPGATIGGMISTGCSGTNAVRYGTAKAEWFLNITVVLPNGDVIKTRNRARKSSAGFDTTKLFVGAEGTLGIVTEATVRLAPVLPSTVAVCGFPSVERAVSASGEIINKGVPIQCVELCDSAMMKAMNKFQELPIALPDADSIFFKFQGNPGAMKEAQEMVKEIAQKYGGKDMVFAKDAEEAKMLWAARKNAHWTLLNLVEGGKAYSTDVCVPISKLPQLAQDTQKDLAENGIVGPIIGAIELEGTCTGEHGVGIGKKGYLRKELGEGTVALMKLIKNTIDPKGIMNPGRDFGAEVTRIESAEYNDAIVSDKHYISAYKHGIGEWLTKQNNMKPKLLSAVCGCPYIRILHRFIHLSTIRVQNAAEPCRATRRLTLRPQCSQSSGHTRYHDGPPVESSGIWEHLPTGLSLEIPSRHCAA
ncbi:hypothetical protein QFC21_006765 [Naganishia friedmannii]|uniref:Uncharacterized protein n=1 Tax=Naganishia friedmannii TaxID=89922 RepID=A0ACC2V0L3_9TREE|nr:hypothetical protein QFC21_006765 [Naganishia friedmannii]